MSDTACTLVDCVSGQTSCTILYSCDSIVDSCYASPSYTCHVNVALNTVIIPGTAAVKSAASKINTASVEVDAALKEGKLELQL